MPKRRTRSSNGCMLSTRNCASSKPDETPSRPSWTMPPWASESDSWQQPTAWDGSQRGQLLCWKPLSEMARGSTAPLRSTPSRLSGKAPSTWIGDGGIELARQLARVLGRRLADEMFAEIGGRLAIDGAPVGEQRDSRVARAGGEQAIGQEALADDLEQAIGLGLPWVADHGQLDDPAEVEVERREQAPECQGRLGRGRGQAFQG